MPLHGPDYSTLFTLLFFCFIILTGVIIFYLIGRTKKIDKNIDTLISNDTLPKKPKIPCIMCGSHLRKGENLKSEEFKGNNESIIHMYGCPYCYGPTAAQKRICPVCKKNMPKDGYLIGRMWIKKNGKKHLHIQGCTVCSIRRN